MSRSTKAVSVSNLPAEILNNLTVTRSCAVGIPFGLASEKKRLEAGNLTVSTDLLGDSLKTLKPGLKELFVGL